MNLTTWWLFVTATFLVSAAPGPNMLLILNQSVRYGFRRSIAGMLGCMSALLIMLSISAAGVGLVLMKSPVLFDILRYSGAAYLVYLGYKVWTAPVHEVGMSVNEARVESNWSLYRTAFLTAASNPKALLFAVAFLPQFIHASSPQLPQIIILLATFSVVEMLWYCIYAIGGLSLASYLRQARVLKWFNRVTGGAFIAFAAVMVLVKKA